MITKILQLTNIFYKKANFVFWDEVGYEDYACFFYEIKNGKEPDNMDFLQEEDYITISSAVKVLQNIKKDKQITQYYGASGFCEKTIEIFKNISQKNKLNSYKSLYVKTFLSACLILIDIVNLKGDIKIEYLSKVLCKSEENISNAIKKTLNDEILRKKNKIEYNIAFANSVLNAKNSNVLMNIISRNISYEKFVEEVKNNITEEMSMPLPGLDSKNASDGVLYFLPEIQYNKSLKIQKTIVILNNELLKLQYGRISKKILDTFIKKFAKNLK